MEKKYKVEFTPHELLTVFDCLETMRGLVGAIDEEFNDECEKGNEAFHKALKRSGYEINRPKYKNSNLTI